MQPRLLCTDLDGTLVDADTTDTVDAAFFQRLRAERKNGPLLWALLTERSWASMEALLLRKNFPVWPNWVVTEEREIWLVREKAGIGWYEWNRKCELLHDQLFATLAPVWARVVQAVAQEEGAELHTHHGGPAVIACADPAQAARLAEFLKPLLSPWSQLTVRHQGTRVRLGHQQYTKGSCLQGIAQGLGLNPFAILAAGDQDDDLTMLQRRLAHFLVCPSNATEAVKARVTAEHGFVAGAPLCEGVMEGWSHFEGAWR